MYQRNSEKRLIEAVSLIIEDEGFNKLGVNNIARVAECDKVLIYRYFGGLDGLLMEWDKNNDFYTSAYENLLKELNNIDKDEVKNLTKKIFISQLHFLRNNTIMQEILVWELAGNSKFKILQSIREENGTKLQKALKDKLGITSNEIDLYLTIIIAAIDFIVIYTRRYPILNGLNFEEDTTWNFLEKAIQNYIDALFRTIDL